MVFSVRQKHHDFVTAVACRNSFFSLFLPFFGKERLFQIPELPSPNFYKVLFFVVFIFVFVFVVVAMITEEASDGPGEEEGCHVL